MAGIYIAGPMRGRPAFGFQAFFDAEEMLWQTGVYTAIFNPARRDESLGFLAREWGLIGNEDLSKGLRVPGIPPGMARAPYILADDGGALYYFDLAAAMEADLDFIRSKTCTAIAMLPGWASSKGSIAELELAEELGRQVRFMIPSAAFGYLLDLVPLESDALAYDGGRRPWNSCAGTVEDLPSTEQLTLTGIDNFLANVPALFPGQAASDEVRVTSPTGGQKGRKPERLGLIPGEALDAIARVYAFGAEKYADHNWRKGYSWSLSMDALLRHVNAVNKGQWLDEESGEPHLAHAAFHLNTMLTWAATGQTEQNDLYGLELPTERSTSREQEALPLRWDVV